MVLLLLIVLIDADIGTVPAEGSPFANHRSVVETVLLIDS